MICSRLSNNLYAFCKKWIIKCNGSLNELLFVLYVFLPNLQKMKSLSGNGYLYNRIVVCVFLHKVQEKTESSVAGGSKLAGPGSSCYWQARASGLSVTGDATSAVPLTREESYYQI